MNNHWEKGLNIKQLILDNKPIHILEIGCLEGKMTENILSLQNELDFKLTCISDDLEMKEDGVRRIRGISYEEISKLEDNEFDFVLLDTDHNYWTMEKELAALHSKMKHGCTIVIHDVEVFYYNTGVAVANEVDDTYANRSKYPLNEIREYGDKYGGMTLAIIDMLSVNRYAYSLHSWISDGIGICVIKKNPEKFMTLMIAPASVGKNNRKGSRELTQV
jgi:predicted O-methyltransferase YrrM